MKGPAWVCSHGGAGCSGVGAAQVGAGFGLMARASRRVSMGTGVVLGAGCVMGAGVVRGCDGHGVVLDFGCVMGTGVVLVV